MNVVMSLHRDVDDLDAEIAAQEEMLDSLRKEERKNYLLSA